MGVVISESCSSSCLMLSIGMGGSMGASTFVVTVGGLRSERAGEWCSFCFEAAGGGDEHEEDVAVADVRVACASTSAAARTLP